MDDLISRAAALEVIEAVKNITWSQSGKVLCGKMYSQIKDLPAVDAAPVVHGRWVYENEAQGDYSHCSECGCRVGGGRISDLSVRYKFCPNCGAKMDAQEADC